MLLFETTFAKHTQGFSEIFANAIGGFSSYGINKCTVFTNKVLKYFLADFSAKY